MIDQQGENGCRDEQELDPERIMVVVVRRLEFDVHEIDCGVRRSYKHHFHKSIISRYVSGDEI